MDKTKVKNIVSEVLADYNAFLVDLTIGANNKISVWADSKEGMNINRLKMINRNIEKGLDRDTEDFDLTISSPGLDQPFKVFEQYELNIGRLLKVENHEGEKVEGRLKEVNKELIILETKAKKKEPSKTIEVPFDTIKETKVIIEFK